MFMQLSQRPRGAGVEKEEKSCLYAGPSIHGSGKHRNLAVPLIVLRGRKLAVVVRAQNPSLPPLVCWWAYRRAC